MPEHAPLCYRSAIMEDYKPFKIVSVLRNGKAIGITSAYDAAVFILEKWPDEDGPKARLARQILLNCLAGECSAAVARVAFVEAAKEAGIYVETTPRRYRPGSLSVGIRAIPSGDRRAFVRHGIAENVLQW
ncbi:DUF982 domain-containing protein [Phyllobacterium zundukense]|uniref:DUF982 domain-containing protein n=1 Tax=Phyllobacterium zundukense TaxID=1867719 RepID=A0A2N9VW56_9HYPH|nr:DUF982 domain-containing protein [Phyllobacterium zundukense]ATU91459.1 hypothetical protein BLM14_07310 [Phyllobacterium zundukense]PIO43724.1 hypothetical protein B5P45_17690 [Phyllobacterium zundukense]